MQKEDTILLSASDVGSWVILSNDPGSNPLHQYYERSWPLRIVHAYEETVILSDGTSSWRVSVNASVTVITPVPIENAIPGQTVVFSVEVITVVEDHLIVPHTACFVRNQYPGITAVCELSTMAEVVRVPSDTLVFILPR